MKKSASRLHDCLHGSRLYVVPHMKHGELSLLHANQYVALLEDLILNK
jgi:hypothetical protein